MPPKPPPGLLYLVATDGSECSRKAVDRAIEMARASGAALHVVSVDDIAIMQAEAIAAAAPTYAVLAVETEPREIVAEAARHARAAGVAVTTSVVPMSEPAAAIVRQARERGAALILVGSHGRTGLARALLGSVAEKVVRHASCSVLVVR